MSANTARFLKLVVKTLKTISVSSLIIGILVLIGIFAAVNLGLDREARYYQVATDSGPFAFIAEEIFHETEDLDVLFLGSSDAGAFFYPEIVQEALTEATGKEARVLTMAFAWRGEDLYFTILKDLLARRRVKTVFINPPIFNQEDPHPVSRTMIDWAWLWDLQGIPWHLKGEFWREALLGSLQIAQNEFQAWRTGQRPDPSAQHSYLLAKTYSGALVEHMGYLPRAPEVVGPREPFVDRSDLQPPQFEPAEILFTGGAHSEFEYSDFSSSGYNEREQYFLDRIVQLAKEFGFTLGYVQTTMATVGSRAQKKVQMRPYRFAEKEIPLVGVTFAKLFAGLPQPEDFKFLYIDSSHTNAIGAQYYTKAILPALLKVHWDGLSQVRGGPSVLLNGKDF